jgi:hypothetical protein
MQATYVFPLFARLVLPLSFVSTSTADTMKKKAAAPPDLRSKSQAETNEHSETLKGCGRGDGHPEQRRAETRGK